MDTPGCTTRSITVTTCNINIHSKPIYIDTPGCTTWSITVTTCNINIYTNQSTWTHQNVLPGLLL